MRNQEDFWYVWRGIRCCSVPQPQCDKSLFASFSSEKEDSSFTLPRQTILPPDAGAILLVGLNLACGCQNFSG